MAVLIPKDLGREALRASRTETQVVEAFAAKLPDDHTLYQYERLAGTAPALVLIGPALGVMLLDIRSWQADAIIRVSGFDVEVREGGATSIAQIQSRVASIERAVAHHAASNVGTEWCPVTPALILPNISWADLDSNRAGGSTLRQALNGHSVLTREDIAGDLFARLREVVPSPNVTPEQLDVARATLFPELHVTWASRSVVLDRRQDELVHLPDAGHHVIEAPAGSGKTSTLIARARYLRRRHRAWRILVLTFNRVTADLLRAALPPDERLDILHLHSWCWRALDRGGLDIPALPTGADRAAYWKETIPRLLMQGFNTNRLGATQFDAILVDDGHDFMRSWYEVIVRALNPSTGSLFIVSDRHQALRPIDLKACGVNAAGVISTLTQNYRTHESIARAARTLVDPSTAEDVASAAAHGARGGFAPDVRSFPSRDAERKQVLTWLRQRLTGNVNPESILILGLVRPDMVELETWLEDAGISARLASGRSVPGVVRLSTVHGAKGLEADFVLLLHAHQLDQFRPDDARQLLYVAMTRARVQLAVYSHAPSALLDH